MPMSDARNGTCRVAVLGGRSLRKPRVIEFPIAKGVVATADARSSPNALCTARSAATADVRWTSTLILISLVVIISMFTPASASASNIEVATPVCVRIPRPTTETLETSASWVTPEAPIAFGGGFGREQRLGQVAHGHGEADLRLPLLRDVLDDHVHDDVGLGDAVEDPMHDARPVGNAQDRDPALVMRERRTRDADAQPAGVAFGDDPGPLGVGERAPHVDRHAVFLGELDRPRVHHARPQAGKLEHLIVTDPVDLARLGNDPGIGGVDAVHIRIDLAGVGPENGGERNGGGVGAAPAEGRDVVVLIDALEAGDDDDLALVQAPG